MSEEKSPSNTDAMLRLLVQQTCEHAVMLLDPQGNILAWYRGAEETFGYSEHEVLGRPVSMLFTQESLEKGMDRYEREVARTDIEAEDDRWMVRKDGSRFWASGVLSPINDARRQLIGFGKVLRDRTDQRATTEALANQNRGLKQDLRHKDQFISTLAHELRNPLSSIVNAAQLLKDENRGPDILDLAVSIMEREAAAMRRMVDDLMDATRVAAGKVDLQKQRQQLCPIVESSVEACRGMMDGQVQRLHVILPSAPLELDADADRLRQVFVNLIQNAAKATRNGGAIWVKVSIEGDEAVVKIEDTGVGISPDLLPRIFDLFTQAELASDRQDGGLGIGLSVVKDLTQLHGGTVQVRSDGVGKGSEFTVRLPLSTGGATVQGPA